MVDICNTNNYNDNRLNFENDISNSGNDYDQNNKFIEEIKNESRTSFN